MPDVIILADNTRVTREEALGREDNVAAKHAQFKAIVHLKRLWDNQNDWAALVAAYVGVEPAHVRMAHPEHWKRGNFNLVVPMLLAGNEAAEQVLLRVSMPAKVGEEQHPGSVADKIRCEVASYIYIQRHCRGIRTPRLYGFGIPGADGGHFSHASRLPLFRRGLLYIRQLVTSLLRRPVPSNYLRISPPPESTAESLADTGYLVLENFDEARFGKQMPYIVPYGRPLHELHAEEPVKTNNLCRDLARIMIALARVPQPRIGAFRFSLADGTIHLDGRPATCSMAILESEGAQRRIGLDTTYTSVDRYVADLTDFQASAFRDGPNAAGDENDAKEHMASMVFLQATMRHFIGGDNTATRGLRPQPHNDKDDRDGPFFLHLSDSNAGNILVDDDWHVTGIFDLEWLFAAPIGALSPPWKLTWQPLVDVALSGTTGYDAFCASQRVFVDILRDEEEKTQRGQATNKRGTARLLSDAMDANLTSGRTWFYTALTSVNILTSVVRGRLRPLFMGKCSNHDEFKQHVAATYQLWDTDAAAVVAQKLRDREQYKSTLERLFAEEEKGPC